MLLLILRKGIQQSREKIKNVFGYTMYRKKCMLKLAKKKSRTIWRECTYISLKLPQKNKLNEIIVKNVFIFVNIYILKLQNK